MTINEIHRQVLQFKPCSRRQVFRYLKAARVEPLLPNSKPRIYPDTAAERVLAYLGVSDIPTMKQLRDIRRRAAQGQRRAA